METYHLTMATKNIEWHPIIDNTNRDHLLSLHNCLTPGSWTSNSTSKNDQQTSCPTNCVYRVYLCLGG